MINLRNWTKQHTVGLFVGLLTIVASIFIVVAILSMSNGFSYFFNLKRLTFLPSFAAKVISLAALGNLPWFHFVALRKKKWEFGQGLIMATIIDLLLMILIKFLL